MKALLIVILVMFAGITKAQWNLQYATQEGYFHKIQFVSADTGWAAGWWLLIRSTNGGNTWDTLISRPQSNRMITGLSFADYNTGWLLEYYNNAEIYKTTDAGNIWTLQHSAQFTTMWDIQAIDLNTVFAVSSDAIWRTTNGGSSWNSVNIGSGIRTLFFLDHLNGWVAGDGLFKTTDGGNTWIMQNQGISVDDIQFTSPSIGWFGNLFGISKTTDGGATWIQMLAMGDGWHPSTLYFMDSDTGYFGSYYALVKTTNGGTDWTYQIWDNSLNASSICFINPDYGWLTGYPGKIFHTINGGLPVELTSFTCSVEGEAVMLIWTTASESNNRGFEVERRNKEANSLWQKTGFVPGKGTTTEPSEYSFRDKPEMGIFSYRLKQIDYDGSFTYLAEADAETGSYSYSLHQNYPNPFNPITIIKYSVPAISHISIRVYDITGSEIETLVNEEKPAGSYELNWNAANLPSGVYFYKLQVGSFIETKKMVLLR